MSMKGSLMPFDNNNDLSNKNKAGNGTAKNKPQIQPKSTASSSSTSISSSSRRTSCFRAHLNSLWSVWYGLTVAGLQGYIAVRWAKWFFTYIELPWPIDRSPPKLELHVCLGLIGAAALLIPFFLTAAVFKIGNLANDGFKLGRHLSTCTADPPSVLLRGAPRRGSSVFKSLWRHGGPTAPFLHLATAFCLLLPRLLMEARAINAGFITKDAIWRTDLDFMVIHLITSPAANSSINYLPTPVPLVASSVLTTLPTMATARSANTINVTVPILHQVTVTHASRSYTPHSLEELLTPHFTDPGGGGEEDWRPVSVEFLNYALALLVYAVRYPAIFWNTNKAFGTIFSFQLLANGLQSLLSYAGMCVLYKVQVYGAREVLRMLPHSKNVADSPFLLNTHVTLALFVLSNILIFASSLVLYMYGYDRFNAFLNQERERRVIILREDHRNGNWGYFTHCAALCCLLAIAVCNAPLLYDYTVVYRGSLDGAILACDIGTILHLFLWVVIWLLLTIKQQWIFKLRVTIGRAAVRSARSVKLVTDVDLISARRGTDEGSGITPLLVVGNGRTYTVSDTSPKKAIMSVIQKAAMERKARSGQNGMDGGDDGEEQIYWLRPKPPSPKTSPDSVDRLSWLGHKSSGGTKHKVTFNDSLSGPSNRSTSGYKKGKSLLSKSPKGGSKGKNKVQNSRNSDIEQLSDTEEDDGDYATLRELPLADNSDDTLSEDNKLLNSALCDDNVTYARTNRDLTPGDYEQAGPASAESNDPEELPPPPPEQHQFQGSVTPRCLRRADSGMPHEELTPRSDSVSTESSGGSPPCGNHSETSSGVHSNSSSENQNQNQVNGEQEQAAASRRATSVDDITVSLERNTTSHPQWKSFSLQRNVLPPTVASPPIAPIPVNQCSQINGVNPMPNNVSQGQPIYAFGSVNPQQYDPRLAAATNEGSLGGHPAVLLESATESTVVIRRKQMRPKTDGAETPVLTEEPFGRSTNMRMTSFTDGSDVVRSTSSSTAVFPSSSATLPHYPTQPVAVAMVYPHCSTMPLPSSNAGINHPSNQGTGSGSCNSFPRQHTTIPTHHNGIRLFGGPNPFVKRFPPYHQGRPPQVVLAPMGHYGTVPTIDAVRNGTVPGHHTFPHLMPNIKYSAQHIQKQDRDSANFSMASSGDSDQCLPHS